MDLPAARGGGIAVSALSERTETASRCACTRLSFVATDEVRRVMGLLNKVHSLIEERQRKFALTGSSARKLHRGVANLLAGQALFNKVTELAFGGS